MQQLLHAHLSRAEKSLLLVLLLVVLLLLQLSPRLIPGRLHCVLAYRYAEGEGAGAEDGQLGGPKWAPLGQKKPAFDERGECERVVLIPEGTFLRVQGPGRTVPPKLFSHAHPPTPPRVRYI